MVRKSHGGPYPENWKEIAHDVKAKAGWKCVRCGHPHAPKEGYTLTVHHLDMNPSNVAWWNIVPLCQKCHLQIQHKVVLERPWMFEHSKWFKPYAAGYYASIHGISTDYEFVMTHLELLLSLGLPKIEEMTP